MTCFTNNRVIYLLSIYKFTYFLLIIKNYIFIIIYCKNIYQISDQNQFFYLSYSIIIYWLE